MIFLANIYLEGAAFLTVGIVVGYGLVRWKERTVRAAHAIKQQALLENAAREAGNIAREARLKANEEMLMLREQAEEALNSRRNQFAQNEHRLTERETLINRQLENLVQEEKRQRDREEESRGKSARFDAQRAELDALIRQRREQLQALAHLNEADARAQLLKEIEQEAMADASQNARHILEEARTHAEEKARRIIGLAIQRYAGEHTFETTSATLSLPSEDLKGRIIGREGRNIRSFEQATGVTVLIDDTPNAVVLSGFNPTDREIAREAMQRLILDGRIHPTRIEEVVAKVKEEVAERVLRAGEEAVHKSGLPPMHPEISKVLGQLMFRHSFSQNVLHHSVEVAHLAGLMAAELGLDITTAKRAGLLHDIGKALDQNAEGGHAIIGADFIRRLGEIEEVVNAVASHHDEVPATGPYGTLVSAADAISASRPGARSETMTAYIKRVEDLEKIGKSFVGVEKCFAVQAGRELRVLVQPTSISDAGAEKMSKDIAKAIEAQLLYPGQIRVTVVRELKFTGTAT